MSVRVALIMAVLIALLAIAAIIYAVLGRVADLDQIVLLESFGLAGFIVAAKLVQHAADAPAKADESSAR
ncbi:hypothetical protein L4Z68_002379 [Pseudomonas aeruginosa]|uniref:hypothetical protein n=1 Tax=Aquipseudomonas alcaligenes TaxID=43263 RepID=UPI001F443BB5|nr:hypothetical protein [Pseudomonas alcaligenes]EKU6308785.1 hypothetical protein [Pseudomonas aeruginosa]EKX2970363.1 hypothetical protein [Pseudomonas aeruginosa]BDC78558.1 hypothetical protein MRCP2_p2930 [Pseudomonas alcaligenes]HBO6962598.1 hypothetical protein [Pseudomonas aeruginosa]HBO7218263.1 hypothetical protein [Pseudomonas aeruginosa]